MNTDTKPKIFRIVLFVVFTLSVLTLIYALVFRVDLSGTPSIRVQFDYVGTIQVGSPIRKSGVKIGSVGSVEINPVDQKTVIVTLSLYKGQVIRQKDRISIASGGILGDQYIDVYPMETNARVLNASDLVEGQPTLDLRTLVVGGESLIKDLGVSSRVISSFLQRNGSSIDNIIHNVEQLTANSAAVSKRLDSLLTRYEDRIDPTINDLQATLRNLKDSSDQAHQVLQSLNPLIKSLSAKGAVIPLLGQEETAKSLKETLENLRSVSGNLNKITSELEKALR